MQAKHKSWSEIEEEGAKIQPIFERHMATLGKEKTGGLARNFVIELDSALWEAWQYGEQQKLLQKLKHQVRILSEIVKAISPAAFQEIEADATVPRMILDGSYRPKGDDDPKWLEGERPLPAEVAIKGMYDLSENYEDLQLAIEATRQRLPRGIPTRNRNIDAWRVVEAAAYVCRHTPKTIRVPKSTNGSGPFYRLLVDLFSFYNITSEVNGAVRSWRTHIDNKRESLDLLPM